jgi:transcription-repair coupling factor (superfamily II helicase)
MSMSGVRDLSVIETPPLDRLPVETVVTGWSRRVIKEAIDRELGAGWPGVLRPQPRPSLPLDDLVRREPLCREPASRWPMARWRERELEAAMVKFVDGQIDVLVSTAIVESGLDIPASNTIIINRADRFGWLSSTSSRGRVGRERQQAYAYSAHPGRRQLDETAQRRLRAIEEMTEAGRGIPAGHARPGDPGRRQPARRRPARPHRRGRIRSVYEAPGGSRERIEGEPPAAHVEPVIAVDVEALLPESYVPEVNPASGSVPAARRASEDELARSAAELADRSAPSPAVESLLEVVALRVMARALHLERIEAHGGRAALTFRAPTPR